MSDMSAGARADARYQQGKGEVDIIVQRGDGTNTPYRYIIDPSQGSAYYRLESEDYEPALIQVPMNADGGISWGAGEYGPGTFTGGEVDFAHGFDDDDPEDASRKARCRGYLDLLGVLAGEAS